MASRYQRATPLSTSAQDRFYSNNLVDTVEGQPLQQEGKPKQAFVDKLAAAVDDLTRNELRNVGGSDPTVYTGCAGHAFMHVESYFMTKDETHLVKAREPLRVSLRGLAGKRVSFLCGDAGPLALEAVVANLSGDQRRRDSAVTKLEKLWRVARQDHIPDELLYGRAGSMRAGRPGPAPHGRARSSGSSIDLPTRS